ncbi:hypothetical protein CYMTET_4696, partial [Cymbomonas tetramitiformis]
TMAALGAPQGGLPALSSQPAGSQVFLSATLSNAFEFVEWVAHTIKGPVHVVSTETRPTPLQHYIFPANGKGLYQVVDGHRFKPENFAKAMAEFESNNPGRGKGKGKGKGKGGKGGKDSKGGKGKKGAEGEEGGSDSDIYKIVKMVKDKQFEPVIVFSFSRRECEALAVDVSKLDFNTDEEREKVEQIFHAALENLPTEDDRNLPAVQAMLPFLQKGIAVHHSGLLPILKEVVEILFQEHLIKALFATETFAMGLNMPAKTVVFTQVKKFDGTESRLLQSGEYICMSGRAGRRGMDEHGYCILMLEDGMQEEECEDLMLGRPSPLMSTFHLSFYTLLNLLRRSEGTVNMEFVIEHSFLQFQHEKKVPQLEAGIAKYNKELEEMGPFHSVVYECESLGRMRQSVETGKRIRLRPWAVEPVHKEAILALRTLKQQLAEAERKLARHVITVEHCLMYLRSEAAQGSAVSRTYRHGCSAENKAWKGVWVREELEAGEVEEWGFGIVVTVVKRTLKGSTKGVPGDDPRAEYVLHTLLHCAPGSASTKPTAASGLGAPGELRPLPVPLSMVVGLGAMRVNIPKDLRSPEARKSVLIQMQELEKRFPAGLPEMDPVKDMGISDPLVKEAVAEVATLRERVAAAPSAAMSVDAEQLELFEKKAALSEKIAKMEVEKRAGSMVLSFREELKNRSKVLKKLGHISEDGITVTLKGRAACEIDTADELLVTELLFNNAFAQLDSPQLVALMSCFVPCEKSEEMIKLKDELAVPLGILKDAATQIATIQLENKLEIDVDEYVDSFAPQLMDIVYRWAKGDTFSQVAQMSDMFEGSIIRAMRRLDELMVQLSNAAKVIGNTELAERSEKAAETIRRGIIFAASLYL